MLAGECGNSNVGWNELPGVRENISTPGSYMNPAMSFTGSVPSPSLAGSIRSLRYPHLQVPETSQKCHHCHPVNMAIPDSYLVHTLMQNYTPTHCINNQNTTFLPQRGNSYCGGLNLPDYQASFYPEGGWGWLVCAAGFLALLLTTGMQLAFGILHLYAARHLGEHHLMDIAWIGALSTAVSRGSAPFAVGACRLGSPKLTAIIGGFVLALASLFTSFAIQMHQILLSYGLVLGAGVGIVKESACLILGRYFKKRREFVEMVIQAGTGVGIVLFSVFYKEAVGKLGWRVGLQSVTGALSLTFSLGLIYRSASLYHPQRRTITHLKNEQTKIRDQRRVRPNPSRKSLVDLSPLGSRPVQMLMLASGVASFGLYTPVFYIALQGYQGGLEASALVLLQTCLGLTAALGCAAWGLITARPSAQCLVSRQYLCQAALLGVAVAQIALSSVEGYHGLVLATGLYGASLGGALYSLKMLALERLRTRHFARSWALVQAAEALPILLGVPLTGYMNASVPRVGYYVCTLSSLCGAGLLSLVGGSKQKLLPALSATNLCHMAHQPVAACTCLPPPRSRLFKSQSLHVPLDSVQDSRDFQEHQVYTPMRTQHNSYQPHQQYHDESEYNCIHPSKHCCHSDMHQMSLRLSKSMPEGLGNQEFYRPKSRRGRDITVIEQITTSV